MELELAKGVEAFIQPTRKFKTILIEYKFRSMYDPEQATARTLVKNMLVTNSKKYPTQKEMDQQMSWLYGASLSSNSQRFGKQHVITFRLKIVNDKYIGGDDRLLEEAFRFLEEVIFHPNVENARFHEATFNREKHNLRNEFESIEENKSGYAFWKLNQILFKGTDQEYLGIGDHTFLENLTPDHLYQTYREMIQNDTVDIYISGDVEQDRVHAILKNVPLEERTPLSDEVFVQRENTTEVTSEDEEHDVNQGKLLFGFSSPAYYLDQTYFTAMVFNGLFGGFPHSKLFQNVREKESLAYSASSYIDYIRGTMVIQTGIEFEKRNRVEEIVMEQLKDMQNGSFSDELIVQTKEMLLNQYKQTEDNQTSSLSKVYSDRLLAGREVSDDKWMESILAVTKEDVRKFAEQMELQAIFFLKGMEENHA